MQIFNKILEMLLHSEQLKCNNIMTFLHLPTPMNIKRSARDWIWIAAEPRI